MMMEFGFYSPVKLVFGQPVSTALPATLTELGVERVLVLSDAGLAAIGLVDQIVGTLRAEGWQVATFAQVQGNPTVRDVEAALELAREADAQALVALGGGSVIDVGKAAGLLLTNGGMLCRLPVRGPAHHPAHPAHGGRADHGGHRQRDDQGDRHRGRGDAL